MYRLLFVLLCLAFQSIHSGNVHSNSKHELRDDSPTPVATKVVYEWDGHIYSFYVQPLTWEEAAESCERDGGYLAVLEDLREVDLVSKAMDQDLCSFSAFQNLWIGGRYKLDTKRWYWDPTGYEIAGKIGVDDGYPPWHVDLRPGYECLYLEQDLMKQPQFADLECPRERRYLCEQGCARLYDNDGGRWEPEGCVLNPNQPGDVCQLVCNPGYILDDEDTVQCFNNGWNSSLGLNRLPSCRNGDGIGDDLIDNIGRIIDGKDVQILFVVDESLGDITDKQFTDQLNISTAIVKAFPLSANLSAGLLTYSTNTNVYIPVNTDDSCRFIAKSDKIKKSGTNTSADGVGISLTAAQTEITTNHAHDTTLIVLFAGQSGVTDVAYSKAEELKSNNAIIITVDLSGSHTVELRTISSKGRRGDLFYGIADEKVLDEVPIAIERKYGHNLQENCTGIDECEALRDTDRGHWEPATCNSGTPITGQCTLVCNANFSVHGPAKLTCTEEGWSGPIGPVQELPTCYTPDESGGDFGDEINRTLSQYEDASFLFLLDQSGSVQDKNFDIEKQFLQAIVNAFPLDETRKAGLIVFESAAKVPIPMTIDDTCTMLKLVDKVSYEGGGTDIKAALEAADLETIRNNPDNKTLVILLTDGQDGQDLKPAADAIKNKGNLLFTVGVGDYSEEQLIPIATVGESGTPHFFGISSFDVFQVIADYLNTTYNTDHREDCSILCKALPTTERGTWNPETCATTNSNPGQSCNLVCNPAFELRGSNPLICGENGWTGTGGDFKIPQCETPEEMGGDFVDKINSTLAGGKLTNMLFVLDESGSVTKPNFQMEMDFVKAIVSAFPLSDNRSAGVITFATNADTDIPLRTADTCNFLAATANIVYANGQSTDIQKALVASKSEIITNGVHNQTLVFLVTDGLSATDPAPGAADLKNSGHVIFAVGVGQYNQTQLEPLTSDGPDGTKNFFGVKDFSVFQAIADYLNTTYGDGQVSCPNGYQPHVIS